MEKLAVSILLLIAGARSAIVTDCGGTHVTFSGQSSDDGPVQLPGGFLHISLKATTNTVVIPSDVQLVKLITRDSDGYVIPCLDGVAGSCQIELCDFALNYHHLVSVTSSPELTCPISTGTTYELGIDIDFDLLWTAAINTELEEDVEAYNMQYRLISEEGDHQLLGCFDLPFQVSSRPSSTTFL